MGMCVRAGGGAEQAFVHHSEAGRVPGQLDGEGLHQEEEQVVRIEDVCEKIIERQFYFEEEKL
jgi:hypothetical protein